MTHEGTPAALERRKNSGHSVGFGPILLLDLLLGTEVKQNAV